MPTTAGRVPALISNSNDASKINCCTVHLLYVNVNCVYCMHVVVVLLLLVHTFSVLSL